MPRREPFSHEPIEFTSPHGWIRVSEPVPGVFVSKIRGRGTTGVVAVLIRFGEEIISGGRRLLTFHDWEEVSGYDPEGRRNLMEWTERIDPYWDCSHILFSSRIIAMAVSIASLTHGKIVSYSSRRNWEAELSKACAARGGAAAGDA